MKKHIVLTIGSTLQYSTLMDDVQCMLLICWPHYERFADKRASHRPL